MERHLIQLENPVTSYNQLCYQCHTRIIRELGEGPAGICPQCCSQMTDYWGMTLSIGPQGEYSEEWMKRALDRLEIMPFQDVESAAGPARHALEAAYELGIEELKQRALLVYADVLGRKGYVAEGGQIILEVQAWAAEQQNSYILARSHRLLAGFFRRIGETASAFEHSIQAVQHTEESAPLRIRADHILAHAMMLDETGNSAASITKYKEVMDIAENIQDIHLSLAALNNRAYTCGETGDTEEALALVNQLRQLAEQQGVPLDGLKLDTIARIELMLGKPEAAETTLQAVLEDNTGHLISEMAGLPECLLTAAEAMRLQGKLEQAQSIVDKARKVCEKHGFEGQKVRVRLEQARILAAMGRYREAYEEHVAFHDETENLRSHENRTRANILQTVFDTKEARRASEHFREMAFRDALTGLHNRRYLDEQMDGLIQETLMRGETVTAMVIDLDHFKRINDSYSHQIGDLVLVKAAGILRNAAKRAAAIAARYGGEEFVILATGLNEKEAAELAEDVRLAISSAEWNEIAESLSVTTSIGVCTSSEGCSNRRELLGAADHNLYTAKRSGRNRVIGTSMSRMECASV
ncbi:GGDEF domain-containing protein [Paenibacillus zeisoli]|uniref:GGDEF domain-containing protein n=1 Tax=Paenibacillus zeisoli TaxID=2496267 RepID=A0A433XNA4_9BACL|nr:GGDEF domain-containing protein [Paenibacillus zeisoli]RUT35576.1 GGDEF domain-containing protein [Paenibacillus zeisoli]